MVTPEYLQKLRADSCMSWNELSRLTGHPVSTIRDHVGGKVAKPNPAILVSLVGAMGGDPSQVAGISAEMREDLAEIRRAAEESMEVKVTVDTMRRVRGEMLEIQRENYEAKIKYIHEHYKNEIARIEKTSALRLKLCIAAVILLAVMMLAAIAILAYDFKHSDRGWIQMFSTAMSACNGTLLF